MPENIPDGISILTNLYKNLYEGAGHSPVLSMCVEKRTANKTGALRKLR